MINYVLEDSKYGPHLKQVRILEGPFEGTVYGYGKVWLSEKDDQCTLSFEHQVFEVPKNTQAVLDSNEFRHLIGDVLTDILDKQLDKSEVVYTGGVDEA